MHSARMGLVEALSPAVIGKSGNNQGNITEYHLTGLVIGLLHLVVLA